MSLIFNLKIVIKKGLADICSVCLTPLRKFIFHKWQRRLEKRLAKEGVLNEEKFSHLHKYVSDKFQRLFKHEISEHKENPKHPKRQYATIGLDRSKWSIIHYKNRRFAIGATRVMYEIVHNVLRQATIQFPDKFGTKNSDDVLDALYDIELIGERESFRSFLEQDNYACILEIDSNDEPIDNLLRVDLFRSIASDKTEFIGGVFHAYKHFNYKGVPLSTFKEKYNIEHPSTIFKIIIDCYFFQTLTPKNPESPYLISNTSLGPFRIIKAIFHKSPETGVAFVSSISIRTVKNR